MAAIAICSSETGDALRFPEFAFGTIIATSTRNITWQFVTVSSCQGIPRCAAYRCVYTKPCAQLFISIMQFKLILLQNNAMQSFFKKNSVDSAERMLKIRHVHKD